MDNTRGITQCRICKSSNVAPLVEVPSQAHLGTTCRYAVCNDCDTVLDDGSPPINYQHGDEDSYLADEAGKPSNIAVFNSLRWYMEIGAGIDCMARAIVGLEPVHSSRSGARPRFLDVGASFGFACSMAQFRGWDAVGVEPSPIGRAGAHYLGIPMLSKYLEQTDLPRNHFDFVHSSEVIEHVPDVDQFVATVAAYMKPDGVLLLTTPNGQAVRGRDDVEREWEEALSAGNHINILSPQSMEMVLRRNGMAAVQILPQGGTSGRKHLITVASRSPRPLPLLPVPWHQLDTKSFVRSYLAHLIARREQAGKEDFVYRGALYRLFELLVNHGDFAEAESIISKLDRSLAKAGMTEDGWRKIDTDNFHDHMAQAPAFAGLYAYYKGIFYLLYRLEHDRAAESFRLGQRLCTVEQKLLYFPRLFWPSRCRFHVGLALLHGGKPREALREFDALATMDPRHLSEELRKDLPIIRARLRRQLNPFVRIARPGYRLLRAGARYGAKIARAAVKQ
jgi:2-polyprenyl-3-methyl-5-hydroxy-6-metoxy-1,4-benzoquinol methylase